MDTDELHARGLKLRTEMFGKDAVEKRTAAFGEFGKPLQHIINAYAYGDVWSRSALPPATKSLAMVAMMAAAGHANELRVHLKGALKTGCSAEQLQEILLLVTLYCGGERGAPRRRRGAARREVAVSPRVASVV
jgi:4-carboxymuconolactone decarboxylase